MMLYYTVAATNIKKKKKKYNDSKMRRNIEGKKRLGKGRKK